MKEHVYRFVGAVFLTILALLGIGAFFHILVTLPLGDKAPEWLGTIGTWVGGVGTVIAIFASLHLFKKQREQLIQQAVDDRLLAQIRVVHSIEGMIMYAMGVINIYAEQVENGQTPEGMESMLEWLQEVRQNLFRFIEPGTAGWLTHALTRCTKYISEAIPQIQMEPTPERIKKLRHLVSQLGEEHIRIWGRMNMLRQDGERRGMRTSD
jgi:hypothetical protein